ncbi:hypothetical protein I5M27_02255 [Adhaeribacter sp. BT258]|uniref:Uncharacterized protein n=1 Tax=Adhaeribacter terrigena TaxID=2793070 RepID=A0ABS1BXB8_9BACT|nr:hypothetical protein [Adhaeribacter terrigena]MBK0401788.1 hypothetical protein [Adhaeribacter terrigena]
MARVIELRRQNNLPGFESNIVLNYNSDNEYFVIWNSPADRPVNPRVNKQNINLDRAHAIELRDRLNEFINQSN